MDTLISGAMVLGYAMLYTLSSLKLSRTQYVVGGERGVWGRGVTAATQHFTPTVLKSGTFCKQGSLLCLFSNTICKYVFFGTRSTLN